MDNRFLDDRSVAAQIMVYMASRAVRQADGSGVFYGSPRQQMERIGTSSGTAYKRLYALGFVRQGTGSKATWIIPKEFMAA